MQERMAARLPESATARGPAVLSYSVDDVETQLTPPVKGSRDGAVELPPALVEKVAAREAVLLAGAGISLAAGLPSAAALAAGMVQAVRQQDPGYGWSPAGSAFFETATDLEALQGRNRLTEVIRDFVDPPQGAVPTPAHRYALRLFDQILTTNYDELFEEAARQEKLRPAVVVGEPRGAALPSPALVKLQGTVSRPDSLVITERDVLLYDRTHPNLWSAALELLRSRTVIVVGSSLRDPSIVRLLAEAGPRMSGFFVTLSLSTATRARLRSWSLEGIEADANSFLATLAAAVSPQALNRPS